jgi:glycosyltransferase involved in cell wall biosynthesis
MKDPHLYLVGDGPDRMSMEELAAELGISDAVHFVGFVADPRPYLAQTDVFALASHSDPCPLAIAEAREAGCAIVGTRAGGIPELLEGGAAGVLVDPGEPQQLATKLRWLLMDTHARAQLGARAKRNLESLSVERVAREYMAIYQRTLAERVAMDERRAAQGARRAPDGAI